MDFLEDVLDATNRSPREFGAVHVFVEELLRDGQGRAVASVWLQAAYTPCRGAVLIGEQSFAFPELSAGQVVRGVLPLELKAGAVALEVAADAPLSDSSQRVRTPWKLLDTFSVVSQERRPAPSLGLGTALALNVVSIPLGVVIIPGGLGPSTTEAAVKVIKARELGALQCSVTDVATIGVTAPSWEVKWVPGQPLPARHEGQRVMLGPAAVPMAPEAPAPMSAEGLSPWQLAQTVLAQGQSKRDVEAELVKQCGLTEDDVRLLLQDLSDDSSAESSDPAGADVSRESGLNLGSLLGVGMLVVGLVLVMLINPITAVVGVVVATVGLIRVVQTFGVWSEPASIASSTLQALAADAPGNRCGRHSDLMSLGSCPRCGTWCCRACAPDSRFPEVPCETCARSRAFRKERLQKTERWSLGVVVGLASLLLGSGGFALARSGLSVLMIVLLAMVFVLACVFGVTRSVWVALSMLPTAFVTVGVVAFSLGEAGWGLLLLLLVPLEMVGLGALLTLASTQRGHQRALSNAVG